MKALTLCLALALSGCGPRHVHHSAIAPGHDEQHPALTPVGKVVCKTGLLKLFNSYGWRNCKNEPTPHPLTPVPFCSHGGTI